MNLPSGSERLREAVRRQPKALATKDSYVYWLRHCVTALNTRPSPCPVFCFLLSQILLCGSPFVSQKQEIARKPQFVFLRNTPSCPACAILTA